MSQIMSAKKDGDRCALEELNHLQDVSRAWDSLLEAKHVLQRIENKVDIQSWRRGQGQKIRRRLQLDGNSFSGADLSSSAVRHPSHPEREEIYRRKPDQTFTIHSKEPDGRNVRLSSNMDPSPGFSGRRMLTRSPHQDGPSSFSCNVGGMNIEKYNLSTCHEMTLTQDNFSGGQTLGRRGSSEENVEQVLETPHLCHQTGNPEDLAEMRDPGVTSPLTVTHIKPEIRHCSSLDAFAPLLSPKADLYAQKLEHLMSRSPRNKLERLKERIREQKRRQDVLKRNQTKPLPDPERTRKHVMTRKVCKVTFGPTPTVSKGFGAADKESIPVYREGVTGVVKREDGKGVDHDNRGRTRPQAFRSSKENAKSLKSKSPVSRKLSFKSPERKGKNPGLDRYGASAWREGQRLVQQLLGPSPVTLMKRRVADADITHFPQQGSCRTMCNKTESQSYGKRSHQTGNRESAERVGAKQSRDPARVAMEVLAGNNGARNAYKRLGEDRENIGDNITSKSISPKRPHAALDNVEKRPPGKENVSLGDEAQPKSTKMCSYSIEEVRDFMKKKTMERRKAERENRRKMLNALQVKQEQLHRVLKKQKDAFPPKRDTTTSRKNTQRQHCVPEGLDNVRKDPSDWLHVTSSDLLREEDGASKKARKHQNKDPLNTEYSSPLRLQDLSTVLTNRQQDHGKEVTLAEHLPPDAISQNQTSEPFSQDRKERVQAIWATAMDLGRRVELEVNRLGAVKLGQPSVRSAAPASPGSPSRKSSKPDKSPDGANTPTLLQSPGGWQVTTGQLEKSVQDINKEETTAEARKGHPKGQIEGTQERGLIHRPASTSPQRGASSPKLLRGKTRSTPGRRTASPAYSDKTRKRVTSALKDSPAPTSDLRQTQMDIANRLKTQIEQQEKDLAVLRLKAAMEAREAERCMEEMLRRNSQQILTPRVRSPEIKGKSKKQRSYSDHRSTDEQRHGAQRFEAGLEGRTELDTRVSRNISVQVHGKVMPTDNDTSERSWDHTEPATDSTSKWSEVSEFYGSPNMFSRITLEMVQQYLREEELRARHQTALLRLREEALKEKTKAELALLEHQRRYWEMKKGQSKVEDILRQEDEIQKNLKQEQAEIRHLHNIYKAAHQKRKLLLRQQKEVLRIQQSAAHIQRTLQSSGGRTAQVSELIDLELSGNQTRDNTLRNSSSSSEQPHQNTQSAVSDLSEDDDITEDTQPMSTDRAHMTGGNLSAHSIGVPETSPIRWRGPQSSHAAGEELGWSRVTQDGAAAGNPLSGGRAQVTESLQNNPTNPCQKFPTTLDAPCLQSQEKSISANEDNLGVFVTTETRTVPAREHRKNLSLQGQEKKTDPEITERSGDQRQNLRMVASDKEVIDDLSLALEAVEDLHFASKAADDLPLALETADDHSLGMEATDDLPLVLEATDDLPLVLEATDDLPLVLEATDDLPLVLEATDDLPLVLEATDDLPMALKAADDLPLASEVTDIHSLVMEATDDLPLVLEAADDLPLALEAADDLPLVLEVADDLPLALEAADDLPLESKSVDDLPLASEATDDFPLGSEAADKTHLVSEPNGDHSDLHLSVPSKSNVSPQASGNGALSPSLVEFQKVSAILINISESSISASDRGQDGQDTESGDSEVFDMESSEFPSEGQIKGDRGGRAVGQGNVIHQNEGKETIMFNFNSSKKENPEVFYSSDDMSDEETFKPPSSPPQAPNSQSPVDLVMGERKTKTAPLASESFPTSEDLTESDTKTYGAGHLPEDQDSNAVRITDIQKATSMSPKDVGNVAGMSSPDTKDRQRVTETNEKQSVTENVIFQEREMVPFHAITSKDLFQIKSFSHPSEAEFIFITEEVLQPREDTLSEILSPVDEKLSYESADLYSTQQDQSEELPSLPRDEGSIKSGDTDTEDFPTPPEEMLLSRTESLESSREASLIEEIHLLYDNLLTEDPLLPPAELIHERLCDDGNSGTFPLESRSTEVAQQCKPFLTLSMPEEEIHDPLYNFQIGDRVLVKLSKPGTLKFKGLTSFKEGYWAGVALDKAQGDNDGTYEGIKYFDCPKDCGVFARPGQISHLLFDESDGSYRPGDDGSFDEGPSPRNPRPQDQAGGDTRTRRQGEGDEWKQSSAKDVNQSRSCCLESSESINHTPVADASQPDCDISLSCLNTRCNEPIRDDTDPGQAVQIKHFGGGDTNRLISPHPLQEEKHRLILKVTDELISRALCDAIGTLTKISQGKFKGANGTKPVINASEDARQQRAMWTRLTSLTTQEEDGRVESLAHTLVTDIIKDCIKEYKQIKRRKRKENKPPSFKISTGCLRAEEGNWVSFSGDGQSVVTIFADGIYEELVKDSVQLIENINWNKTQYGPPPGRDAPLSSRSPPRISGNSREHPDDTSQWGNELMTCGKKS